MTESLLYAAAERRPAGVDPNAGRGVNIAGVAAVCVGVLLAVVPQNLTGKGVHR